MIEVCSLGKVFSRRKLSKSKKHAAAGTLDVRDHDDGFVVLKDISFSCEPGQSLAILGANGAGKTTLLRLLAGVLTPSSGNIVIDGEAINDAAQKLRSRIGMISNSAALYRRLTGRELLSYYGRLYGMKNKVLAERTALLAKTLELETFLDCIIDKMSTGMKQRLAFARALIHDPEILILDEPTTGMDVLSADIVVRFVEQCRKEGKVILLCTHNMSEVEYLCEDALVLDKGQVVFSGSVKSLRNDAPSGRLEDALMMLIKANKQISGDSSPIGIEEIAYA